MKPERHKERQTGSQKDTKTDRQPERHKERQAARKTERQT